jgi:hypothetical protein
VAVPAGLTEEAAMVVLLPCVAAVEGEVVLPAAEAEEPPEEVVGPALEVVGAVVAVAVLARDDVEEGPEWECHKFCVRGFCEGGFPFWYIENSASAARSASLLGRIERSRPEAA